MGDRLERALVLVRVRVGTKAGHSASELAGGSGFRGSTARGRGAQAGSCAEYAPGVQALADPAQGAAGLLHQTLVLFETLADSVDDGRHQRRLDVVVVLEAPWTERNADEPALIRWVLQPGAGHSHQTRLAGAPVAVHAHRDRQQALLGQEDFELVDQVLEAEQVDRRVVVMPHGRAPELAVHPSALR